MKKKFGFTLAEVLITLGIIGVVAAMTIPTLISNTNSAKFRSQFKKAISTFNQAGLMAQAQYDIDFSTNTDNSKCTADATATDGTNTSICAILKSTLSGATLSETSPYGQTTASSLFGAPAYADTTTQKQPTFTTSGVAPSNPMFVSLADGSLFVFDKTAVSCTKDAKCKGYIDVNGVTLPNKEVQCATASETAEGDGTCNVPPDANHMTDVYPVAIYDATVEPLTNAARYVLTTSK